jgi:CDP-diacylglycerol--serine O-phosphatidyltransferase
MREYVGLANVLTTGSVVAGFLSLVSVSEANVLAATCLIAFAAVCDAFDGPVARLRGTGSAFGANLDSLADMVSFGVAPALALYATSLHAVPIVGAAVCGGFAVCAAWRLARFPLLKDSEVFVGCPAPMAALIVTPLATLEMGARWAMPIVVCMSLLMIGTVRFPTLAGIRELLLRAEPRFFRTTHLH